MAQRYTTLGGLWPNPIGGDRWSEASSTRFGDIHPILMHAYQQSIGTGNNPSVWDFTGGRILTPSPGPFGNAIDFSGGASPTKGGLRVDANYAETTESINYIAVPSGLVPVTWVLFVNEGYFDSTNEIGITAADHDDANTYVELRTNGWGIRNEFNTADGPGWPRVLTGSPIRGRMYVGRSSSDTSHQFFVDGVLQGTSTQTLNLPTDNLSTRISRVSFNRLGDSSPATYPGRGLIEAAFLFPGVALSQAQIRQVYQEGWGGSRTSLYFPSYVLDSKPARQQANYRHQPPTSPFKFPRGGFPKKNCLPDVQLEAANYPGLTHLWMPPYAGRRNLAGCGVLGTGSGAGGAAPGIIRTERGRALSFDGTDDFYDLGHYANINSLERTLFAIFRFNALPAASRPIFQTHWQGTVYYSGLMIYKNPSNQFAMLTGENSSSKYKLRPTTATIVQGEWYAMVASFRSLSDFQIFVDGEIEAMGSFDGTATTPAFPSAGVVRMGDWANLNFDADIDITMIGLLDRAVGDYEGAQLSRDLVQAFVRPADKSPQLYLVPPAAGGITLTVQEALHSHTADNVALTQANTLAMQDALHSHTVDNIDLDAGITLAVQESLHGHTVDNVALTQANTLAIQEALHGHLADNVDLVQANVLAVNEALHSHTSDNLDLDQSIQLVVAECSNGHTVDNVALVQANVVSVQESTHGHTVDNINLAAQITMVVQDATHLHTADNIVLSIDGEIWTVVPAVSTTWTEV